MAAPRLSLHELAFLTPRARLAIALPAIALVLAAFWIAFQFLHPIPPRRSVLAAGPDGSALARAALDYRDILARDGIEVIVRTTQGAGENLRLLTDAKSGVDAGFAEDLHPTLIDLLVDASRQSRALAGFFEGRGRFPHFTQVDAIPVSEQALYYQQQGPSLLRRYLPLWLADFLQRLLTLAVPVIAVVLPLARLLPAAADHLLTGTLHRCYAELRRLEDEVEQAKRPAVDIVHDLDALAAKVRAMRLPVGYADAQFALRRNIDLARSHARI